VILQKYLAPYRVPVFNGLAGDRDLDLTLLYYGKPEDRRKWSSFPDKRFSERQCRCISIKAGYEANVEFPHSILRDLARIRPDVIICAPDSGGLAAWLYAQRYDTRICIWSEATPVTERRLSRLKNRLRNAIYHSAASFLVPGSLAESYLRSYRPDADMHRAPNAIDETQFAVSQSDLVQKFAAERLLITFSGSLIERKGIYLLLEAFRQLMAEQPELQHCCQLRIMGTGPLDLGSYQADNIEFCGFCEKEAYSGRFRESHIFVLPSLHDNNPLTVVEGLFAGNVMLLGEGVGNYPEAVRGNGLVVSSNSVQALKEGLAFLMGQPREVLIRFALQSIEIAPDFSIRQSVNGFRAAIDAALANAGNVSLQGAAVS
jgi:glycosyltransferase involved in cell wall biosynthesis